MTPHQLIRKVKELGYVFLREDGHTRHVELPRGHEQLKSEVKENREPTSTILKKQQNAKRKRKAPLLAPELAQPVYILPAYRCSKYPHAHVTLEAEPHTIKTPGDLVFEYLREQVRKCGVHGDDLPVTQAVPEEKVELSPWSRPKIKGYTKYRWEGTD
jgi:hypothetical protein